MKTFDIVGTITDIERLNSSVNGNPRFRIVVNGTVLLTKSDYSYCYNIDNLYKRGCKVVVSCYETKTSTKIQDIKEIK